MSRNVRTPEELRAIAGHLRYEIDMLIATAQELSTGRHAGTPINNALLEAFSIHARAVLDVFYPPTNARDDDVVAQDFLPAGTDWAASCPKITVPLANVRARTGKEIAHLTYARLAVPDDRKPWPFTEILRDLEVLVGAFTAVVSPDNLGHAWHQRMVPN
jgi:hypothetical protein